MLISRVPKVITSIIRINEDRRFLEDQYRDRKVIMGEEDQAFRQEEGKAKASSNSTLGKTKNIERPDEPLDLIDED